MKKILTGIFATIAILAFAAGCTKPGDSSSVDESNSNSIADSSNDSSVVVDEELQTAAEFLESKYKKQNVETRQDYTIDPMVMGYPITWTVDVTEGVSIVVSEDGKTVTVDVDENLDADLTYVLTATLSSESGATATVSFTRKVLAALAKTPQAITEAPVEGTAYKYHVYQSTLATDMYFAGSMNGFYFKTTTDYNEAVDVYAEYVDDTTFNLYFNHTTDGKQYIGVRLSDDGAHDNIVYTSTPVSSFVWNAELGTVTTHLDVNKNKEAADYYLGNYSTHETISASMLSYAGGDGNNVGHLVEMVDRTSITAEDKVAFETEALNLETEYVGDKSIELATLGVRYSDVTVAWAIESENASVANGVLTITAPTAETTVTLTATITCGTVSETKAFTLTLKPAVSLPDYDTEISIPTATAIGEAQEANVLTEGKYYVSGTVTEIKSTTYGNLYIQDADGNSLYVYGCYDADGTNRYDVMENAPQVGDTVKLYSAITSYNGSAQLKNAWVVELTAGESGGNEDGGEEGGNEEGGETPVVPTEISIVDALALGLTYAHNTYTTDKYYVTGKIDRITNTTYGNMYIKDADGNEILVYGTYNADGTVQFNAMESQPQVGDTVKLYSIIGSYSNAAQLKNAWIIEVTPATDAEKVATEKAALSLPEAVTGARSITLAANGSSDANVSITWEVKEGNAVASIVDGTLEITNPAEETTVKVVAVLTLNEVSESVEFTIVVSHKDETSAEPSELAVFEFGDNGTTGHADGTDIGTSKTYEENGYTLALTDASKVFAGAKDETGISCLKLGTSSVVGTFTFTVESNVTKVVINVAKYKAKTTQVDINGTTYTIETSSNDGAYTAIEIDTTTTKTITLSTVSGACRAMINSIVFIG